MIEACLITGASSGLGLEFSKICAKNKHNLVLVARRIEILNELKIELEREYSIKVFVFQCDLSNPSNIDYLYEYTQNNNIFINILINNAGLGDYGLFSDCDISKQLEMIQLNNSSLVKLTHLYLQDMIKHNNGHIMNIASIASFTAGPLMSVYYATKAFVLSFSEALDQELSQYNIKVFAYCPGPTNTNFEENAKISSKRLSQLFKSTSPYSVSLKGYNYMMKNKTVKLAENSNKVAIFLIRFIPRSIVRKIVYTLQK